MKSIKGTRGYVWTDKIENGFRHIYIRCLACKHIFELGNKSGTLAWPLEISENNDVKPCIICPYCSAHVWTQLVGYEPKKVSDMFSKRRRPRRVIDRS